MGAVKYMGGEKRRPAQRQRPIVTRAKAGFGHSKKPEIKNGNDVRAILVAIEIVAMRLRLILEELEAHDELRKKFHANTGQGPADGISVSELPRVAIPGLNCNDKKQRRASP